MTIQNLNNVFKNTNITYISSNKKTKNSNSQDTKTMNTWLKLTNKLKFTNKLMNHSNPSTNVRILLLIFLETYEKA